MKTPVKPFIVSPTRRCFTTSIYFRPRAMTQTRVRRCDQYKRASTYPAVEQPVQPNTAAERATVSAGGWALPAVAERSGTVAARDRKCNLDIYSNAQR